MWVQRSKYISATAQKSTKANFIKIYKKVKYHERICHVQNIGSNTLGQGHNPRSKVKSFLLTYQKTTVASVIKLHAKGNNNEICFY